MSISDTQGNAYSTAVATTTSPGANLLQILYASNIKGGADTVTVTYSGTTYNDLNIFEYAGLGAFDVASSATGTGTTATSGAVTTHYANELLFGWGISDVGRISAGSSFAPRDDFDGNIAEDKVVSAAGSYTATSSLPGVYGWAMGMATFRINALPLSYVTLTAPTDSAVYVATGTPITIKIGSNATYQQTGTHWITNPSSGGTYTISVGGTFGGRGYIPVTINAGQTVAATVAENLSFTVNPVGISYVQGANGNDGGYGNAQPTNVVFPNNTVAGDLIVVGIASGGATSTMFDSQGNTFVHDVSLNVYGGVDIYHAANIKGGPDTVTVHIDNWDHLDVIIHEYSGVDRYSPLDVTSTNSGGSGKALDSGSKTTNFPNELIFGLGSDIYNTDTVTVGANFALRRIETGNGTAFSEDRVVNSTASYNATATINHSTYWGMAMATFKSGGACTADDGATVNAVGTTPTVVDFGTMSQSNTFYQGCQDLTVSTNAMGGYSLTVQESTAFQTADGKYYIPDTTCDAENCSVVTATTWVTPTKYGLGHTCANVSGSDCNASFLNGTKFKPVPNVAGGTGPGTISFVQNNTNAVAGCGAGHTCSVAFTGNNTAGNLIIVSAEVGNNHHVSSISDTEGNTYATATLAVTSPGTNVGQIFYAQNIKGGANTVTVALDGSTTQYTDLYLLEYAGLATSGALDVTSTASGTGNSVTSGAATTTVQNELIFGYGSGDGGTYSSGFLFNGRSTFDGNIAEDETVNAAGSYTATASLSGSYGWTMSMATFKGASIASTALMSNTGPVASSIGRVKYRLSHGPLQAAGSYSTVVTYTILGTF